MGTSRRAVHLADLGFVHFNDFASAAQRHDADNLHGPAMRTERKLKAPKKASGGGTNRMRKVGGIPITSAAGPGTSALHGAVRMGDVMTRILNDFLLFACATLFVTGIVLAAAKLLI
jgi:hypothetical protein